MKDTASFNRLTTTATLALISVLVTVFATSILMVSFVPLASACQGGDARPSTGGPCVTPSDPRHPSKDGNPGNPNREANLARQAAVESRKRQAAAKKDATSKGDGNRSVPADPSPPAGDTGGAYIPNLPPDTTTKAGQTLVSIPPPAPKGDIQVITYLDVPDKKNDSRIGGVKVAIKPASGSSECATHTKGNGKTNSKRFTTRKSDKKKILTKGTINFISCNTGTYTVSMDGRKGYSIRSGNATSKTVSVNNNQTTEVKFVLTKNVKTSAKKSGKTTSSAGNATGSGSSSSATAKALDGARVTSTLTKTGFANGLTTATASHTIEGVNCANINVSHKWNRYKATKFVGKKAYKKGTGTSLDVQGTFAFTHGATSCTATATVYAGKAFTLTKNKGTEIQDELTIKAKGKTKTFKTNRIVVGE